MTATASPVGARLDRISTHLTTLRDVEQFVFRYGPAIRAYLDAILRDPHAAEEVSQEIVAKLLGTGGPDRWPRRGRYRFYLKVVVRNAAVSHLRKKRGAQVSDDWFGRRAAADGTDAEWRSRWQRCVLDKAWRELDRHERDSGGGNLCATVLRLVTDNPESDSIELAEMLTGRIGRPVTAEAFRQQVSRARRLMAATIVAEVSATIAHPTPEEVQQELIDLRLWTFVNRYLPAGQQSA